MAGNHPAEGRIRPNPAGGSSNESPTEAQKNPAPVSTLRDGPDINLAGNGAYRTASYLTKSGAIRTDN